MITVDQLRGDMPFRFSDRFGSGGFRRLLEHGLVFRNAHYRYAATVTATGYATLFTGRLPAQHGIVGNEWFDVKAGRMVNCVEGKNVKETQPPALLRPEDKSADRMLVPTLGDDLKRATEGEARVYGLSGKDRGALLPVGRQGTALWYDSAHGAFVTNRWVGKQAPPGWWSRKWAAREVGPGARAPAPVERYRDAAWTLTYPRRSYQATCPPGLPLCPDSRPFQMHLMPDAEGHPQNDFPYRPGLSRAGPARRDIFPMMLPFTPFLDGLTEDLAEDLIRGERLGQDAVPDLLSISFSATDYIGHVYGPDSLEAEDNLLQLDKTLARLFRFLDQEVGRDHFLVVLSADHGVEAIPEYTRSLGFHAGRLMGRAGWLRWAHEQMEARFQTGRELVRAFSAPGFYLDRGEIAAAGLKVRDVAEVLAAALEKVEGVRRALTLWDLTTPAGVMPYDPLRQQVKNGFYPGRSGDVLLVPEPEWLLANLPQQVAAMHGSPYDHSTHVPILMAGPGMAPGTVHRRVAPAWIAATVARLLGLTQGLGDPQEPVLEEAFSSRRP